jgi:hypothetical protein
VKNVGFAQAAASLLNCLLSVPNTETGIADHVEMLLDDLSQATTWVHRHGINMTMHLLCLDTVKVLLVVLNHWRNDY